MWKMNLVLRELRMSNKILIAAILSLSLIIAGSSFLFGRYSCNFMSCLGGVANENSRLVSVAGKNIEIFSKNPDLIFENISESSVNSFLNYKFVHMYDLPEIFYPWKSDDTSYLVDGYPPGMNKTGVVLLHPISVTAPSHLYQDVNLSDGDYVVAATIANIGNYTSTPCGNCNDNVFVIRVVDLATGAKNKIYEDEVNSKDGWKSVYLDISDYSNKTIQIVVEGHAGGACGDWCAEFGAIDKFYVAKVS